MPIDKWYLDRNAEEPGVRGYRNRLAAMGGTDPFFNSRSDQLAYWSPLLKLVVTFYPTLWFALRHSRQRQLEKPRLLLIEFSALVGG